MEGEAPVGGGGASISFDSATGLITDLATAYGPAVVGVFGVGLGIAAIVWGFPRLISLFKRSAK